MHDIHRMAASQMSEYIYHASCDHVDQQSNSSPTFGVNLFGVARTDFTP